MKILFLGLVALLFIGCSGEKKSDEKAVQEVKQEVVHAKVEPKEVLNAVEVTPVEESVTKDEKVTAEVPKVAAVEVAKVKTETVPKEMAVIDKTEIDGAALFKKCASCHGKNAEKKALGKSNVIQGWSKDKIVNAVNGYKDGTYGGAMKAVMKGQVSNLSDADVNAVSQYISKL